MKKQFEQYLINKEYATTTKSGRPSTVYDYLKRIDKVCKRENITWENLFENINDIITLYNIGGSKENLGKKSHNSVINALKRFSEFVTSSK